MIQEETNPLSFMNYNSTELEKDNTITRIFIDLPFSLGIKKNCSFSVVTARGQIKISIETIEAYIEDDIIHEKLPFFVNNTFNANLLNSYEYKRRRLLLSQRLYPVSRFICNIPGFVEENNESSLSTDVFDLAYNCMELFKEQAICLFYQPSNSFILHWQHLKRQSQMVGKQSYNQFFAVSGGISLYDGSIEGDPINESVNKLRERGHLFKHVNIG